MKILHVAFLLGAVVLSGVSVAAECATTDWRPQKRWRGFNVLTMFIKGGRPDPRPGEVPRHFGFKNPQDFREEEFQMMQDWGMDFVRIPLDYRYWIKDGDWNVIDEKAVGFIDRLVALGKRHGIHVQLCFHRAPGYRVGNPSDLIGNLWEDEQSQLVCAKHWAYFARRYRDIPNEELSFNIVNEPHGVTSHRYAEVMKRMIASIRREDPKRFIVCDGVHEKGCGYVPCEELFGIPGVGQSTHLYWPQGFTRGGDLWPMAPDSPQGVFAQPRKKGWYAPFSISNLPPCKVTVSFGDVSRRNVFVVKADGKPIGTFVIDPEGKTDDPNWRNVKFQKQWKCWQGTCLGTANFDVPDGARELTMGIESGDWAVVKKMAFVSKDGRRTANLPFLGLHGWTGNFCQRFMKWSTGCDAFASCDSGGKEWRYPGAPGKELLYRCVLSRWQKAIDAGVFVMIGEFGISPQAEHGAALRWLEDYMSVFEDLDLGWAMWGLFRDRFGILDSGRTDVPLEDFRGHKLDRQMLNIMMAH